MLMVLCRDNQIAPTGALIQRGGGTGPAKPRQPSSDQGSVFSHQCKVIGTEGCIQVMEN
jgi:hypothetical protein